MWSLESVACCLPSGGVLFLLTSPCSLPEAAPGHTRLLFLTRLWKMLFHHLCSLWKPWKKTCPVLGQFLKSPEATREHTPFSHSSENHVKSMPCSHTIFEGSRGCARAWLSHMTFKDYTRATSHSCLASTNHVGIGHALKNSCWMLVNVGVSPKTSWHITFNMGVIGSTIIKRLPHISGEWQIWGRN